MNQSDINALTEIIEHNIPNGSRKIALIDTLIRYVESMYKLDITKLNDIKPRNQKPIQTIPTIQKLEKTVIVEPREVSGSNETAPMEVIPKVLCRLKQEMGYGQLASEGDDG